MLCTERENNKKKKDLIIHPKLLKHQSKRKKFFNRKSRDGKNKNNIYVSIPRPRTPVKRIPRSDPRFFKFLKSIIDSHSSLILAKEHGLKGDISLIHSVDYIMWKRYCRRSMAVGFLRG